MRTAAPDIVLIIQYSELSNMLDYLHKCNNTAFVNELGYTRFEPYREALFKYIIHSLFDKTFALILKHAYTRPKKIKFRLTHAERLTLSVMFKRVEVMPTIIHLQTIIINQLTLKTPQNG